MSNNNVVEINNRDIITDALTDMLRTGAQQLIQQAVQLELAELMKQYTDRLTDEGKVWGSLALPGKYLAFTWKAAAIEYQP